MEITYLSTYFSTIDLRTSFETLLPAFLVFDASEGTEAVIDFPRHCTIDSGQTSDVSNETVIQHDKYQHFKKDGNQTTF